MPMGCVSQMAMRPLPFMGLLFGNEERAAEAASFGGAACLPGQRNPSGFPLILPDYWAV